MLKFKWTSQFTRVEQSEFVNNEMCEFVALRTSLFILKSPTTTVTNRAKNESQTRGQDRSDFTVKPETKIDSTKIL